MDDYNRHFESSENLESQHQRAEVEQGEANLRSIERQERLHNEPIPDRSFVDTQGRDITVRAWESGNNLYVRAYDAGTMQVPDQLGMTQNAGHAEASIAQGSEGPYVHMSYIETSPDYRGAGISEPMLDDIKAFGQKHGATEIRGSVENEEAKSYWTHQADKGWTLDQTDGYYGTVHYKL